MVQRSVKRRLAGYVLAKKYQANQDRWYGYPPVTNKDAAPIKKRPRFRELSAYPSFQPAFPWVIKNRAEQIIGTAMRYIYNALRYIKYETVKLSRKNLLAPTSEANTRNELNLLIDFYLDRNDQNGY